MTSLTPASHDVVGHLRAVNLLLAILSAERIEFPINARRMIEQLRGDFEELIVRVAGVSQFFPEYRTLRSALDDHCDEKQQPLDADELAVWLSVYSGSAQERSFTVEREGVFREELGEVLIHQIHALVRSSLWTRVAFYDAFPDARLPWSPKQELERIFELFVRISPPLASWFESRGIAAEESIQDWLGCDSVLEGLSRTLGEEANGLRRVIEQLQT